MQDAATGLKLPLPTVCLFNEAAEIIVADGGGIGPFDVMLVDASYLSCSFVIIFVVDSMEVVGVKLVGGLMCLYCWRCNGGWRRSRIGKQQQQQHGDVPVRGRAGMGSMAVDCFPLFE